MYDNEDERGYHAHKNLEQILICIHGVVKYWIMVMRK